jgi:TolB-like protein/Tfp pilus assembly protein PilF
VADTPANVPPEGEVETLAAPATSAPVGAHTVETVWLIDLWSRVKEHKIAQWTVAYAAFAFVTLHAATLVSDALEWPHVLVRALTLVLMLGLPMAPILAWYHGVRALRRVSIPELILIVLLLVIAGALLWRSPHPAAEQARTETANPAVSEPAKPESSAPVFAPPAHSIAVLPFVNMSGDAKQEYFSDGISEELLNSLSRLNDLQVVARTSSFSFKGQNVDVATIARKLNVGAVLEGSVRRAGNTVRITVQLINAVSGFHIWSQAYDRNLTDILKVQTDVATSVAQQLESKLAGDETGKIEMGGTHNPEAYDAYLRGVQLTSGDFSEASLRAELAEYDRAIALDPDYAAAYAGRAISLSNMTLVIRNLGTREQIGNEAIAAARRAVALAPEFGEAHLALAVVLSNDLSAIGAAREFDRALALSPGSARVQRLFAFNTAELGHFEPALTAARRAVSLDPQNSWSHLMLSHVFYLSRRFAEARAPLEDAQALSPGSYELSDWLAMLLLGSGEIERARQLCESSATPMEEDARYKCLALVYHALGRQADAESQLKTFQVLDGDASAYSYAEVLAQWGDRPAALQWLNKAVRQRDPLLQLLKGDWMLDPIRNEPQFKAIQARMNFPP